MKQIRCFLSLFDVDLCEIFLNTVLNGRNCFLPAGDTGIDPPNVFATISANALI